jgi:YHS domain-containing protein
MAQKDPVCNMMIDEKKVQHVSEVNEQKIYLCSAYCKSQFGQNPSKYEYWVKYFRNSSIRNILSNSLEVPFLSYSFPSNFLLEYRYKRPGKYSHI